MSQNNNPVFSLTPKFAQATVTATTTDKTGATTTNIVNLYTASTNGTKISQIGLKFQGTSTAGTLLIWITDTGGTILHLFDEIVISAVSSSTTAATARLVNIYTDLQLASGQIIKVGATTVNTSIEVFATIGEF